MKTNERDLVLASLLWTSAAGFTVMMLGLFVLSPLAYLWIMGTVGSVAVLAASFIGAASMTNVCGIFGVFAAQDIIKAGFEVVGAILMGLLNASRS